MMVHGILDVGFAFLFKARFQGVSIWLGLGVGFRVVYKWVFKSGVFRKGIFVIFLKVTMGLCFEAMG